MAREIGTIETGHSAKGLLGREPPILDDDIVARNRLGIEFAKRPRYVVATKDKEPAAI
jgi:hypothetical protein